jgi:hypothetical protein
MAAHVTYSLASPSNTAASITVALQISQSCTCVESHNRLHLGHPLCVQRRCYALCSCQEVAVSRYGSLHHGTPYAKFVCHRCTGIVATGAQRGPCYVCCSLGEMPCRSANTAGGVDCQAASRWPRAPPHWYDKSAIHLGAFTSHCIGAPTPLRLCLPPYPCPGTPFVCGLLPVDVQCMLNCTTPSFRTRLEVQAFSGLDIIHQALIVWAKVPSRPPCRLP